jgi:hypothetical protein
MTNERIYKFLALYVTLLFISACVHAKAIRYETTERPSKPDNFSIEIFEAKHIERPYKVIGLVEAESGGSIEKIINRLKAEARKMGGDALIELHQQPIGAGIPSQGGTMYYGHVKDLWSAKVIVWE